MFGGITRLGIGAAKAVAAPVASGAIQHPTAAKWVAGSALAGTTAFVGWQLLGGGGSGPGTGLAVTPSAARGERVGGVPLDRSDHVVYSSPVGRLQEGDELVTRADIGLTNDVASRRRQAGAERGAHDSSEWRYDTEIEGTAILGSSPSDTTGPVVAEGSRTVTPSQHHGSLGLDATTEVDEELASSKPRFVNVVAEASVPGSKDGPDDCHSRSTTTYAGASDFGDDCQLTVDEGHGILHAMRVRDDPEDRGSFERTTDEVRGGASAIEAIECPTGPGTWPRVDVEDQVVVSLPVGDVKRGEVLDVRAMLRADNRLKDSVLLKGDLILANTPEDTRGRAIGVAHGENVLAGDSLDYGRQGIIEVTRDATDQYVNFIAYAGLRGCTDGDALDLDPGKSSIQLERYTPGE